MTSLNGIGEQLMNIDVKQAIGLLQSFNGKLVVAVVDIIIIDTLLLLAGVKNGLLRTLVALAILYAVFKGMTISLFLFNTLTVPLTLALAGVSIVLRLIMLPAKIAKKKMKKKGR